MDIRESSKQSLNNHDFTKTTPLTRRCFYHIVEPGVSIREVCCSPGFADHWWDVYIKNETGTISFDTFKALCCRLNVEIPEINYVRDGGTHAGGTRAR